MEGGSWVWIPAPPPGFILNGKKIKFQTSSKNTLKREGGGWGVVGGS